jgi:hypothetical protein
MRISLHPTMTDDEVEFIAKSMKTLAKKHQEWREDYLFDPACLELVPKQSNPDQQVRESIESALTRNFHD